MILATIIIIFMFLASIFIFWRKNGREIVMINKLPGPNIFELIRTAFKLPFEDRSTAFALPPKWFKKYGPVVGAWYGYDAIVFLKDPDHIEKIVRHDPFCRRLPDFLIDKVMMPFKGGILAIEGKRWKSRRKALNNAFHINILESHMEDYEIYSQILSERLKELADGSFHRLDIMLAQWAMDIVIKTSFGINLDTQKRNDVELIENIGKVIDFQTKRVLKPWLFNDWIFKRSKECREIEEVCAFFEKAISEGIRFKRDWYKVLKKQDNRLDYFLYAHEDPTYEDVLGEVKCFAGAGAETSSTTCAFALALLCEHQDIQQKVFEEQEELFGEDFLRPVVKEDLECMPYLEKVLKETMRLFPPLSYLFRTTIDDVDIGDGYIVPKGTFVAINIFETHRIPKYFPDPEKFDPDRFLTENCIGRDQYSYIPFGVGRRTCIGNKMAMMEMQTMMSNIIRRFHFLEVKGGLKGIMEGLQIGVVIQPKTRFYFKFQER